MLAPQCPMNCRRPALPRHFLCWHCGRLLRKEQYQRWLDAVGDDIPEVERQIVAELWLRYERFGTEFRR